MVKLSLNLHLKILNFSRGLKEKSNRFYTRNRLCFRFTPNNGVSPELCQFVINDLKFPFNVMFGICLVFFHPNMERKERFLCLPEVGTFDFLLQDWQSDMDPYDDCCHFSAHGFLSVMDRNKVPNKFLLKVRWSTNGLPATADCLGQINCIHCSDQFPEL